MAIERAVRAAAGALAGLSLLTELARTRAVQRAVRALRSASGRSDAMAQARALLAAEVPKAVKAAIGIALIRAAEAGIARAIAPMKLPPALIGLVALSVVLIALEPVFGDAGYSLAQRINAWASPACAFLTKWMPLFFAPALVTLPAAILSLVQTSGRGVGRDLAKSVLIVVAGFLATLVSTANVARFGLSRKSVTSAPRGPAANGMHTARETSTAPEIRVDYDALALILAAAVTLIGACTTSRTGPVLLGATALSFIWGTRLPVAAKSVLHPIVVCGALTAALVQGLRVSAGSTVAMRCAVYVSRAGSYYSALLGPALFALAFKLYAARSMLFNNLRPLLVSTGWTAISALFGTAIAARVLRVSPRLATALLPRTATTPLGVGMASMLDADASLTVCAIVLSGILGASCGKQLLSSIGFKASPRWSVVRGASMGSAGHGLGTAALVADGENEASSAAAVLLVLSGALQTIIVAIPPFRKGLLRIIGARLSAVL